MLNTPNLAYNDDTYLDVEYYNVPGIILMGENEIIGEPPTANIINTYQRTRNSESIFVNTNRSFVEMLRNSRENQQNNSISL